MNYIEAVTAACKDKKTKRKYGKDIYLELHGSVMAWSDNSNILHCDIIAGDWEIVEKGKTLADKVMYALYHSKQDELILMGNPGSENIEKFANRGFIPTDDVNATLKRIKDRLVKRLYPPNFIGKIFKEECGGDLLP